MTRVNYFICFLGLLFFPSCMVCSLCEERREKSGTISENYFGRYSSPNVKCWSIENRDKNPLHIQLISLKLQNLASESGSLSIVLKPEFKILYYWSQSAMDNFTTTSPLVEIHFKVNPSNFRSYSGMETGFTLHFEKESPNDCTRQDVFHCSSNSCVPKNKVCDGIKNCENGADELNCGIAKTEGVATALFKEIAILRSKRTSSWGWSDNTPRAIIALFLANSAKFDGRNLEEEVMAKHAELKTSIALLKRSLSNEQLSMIINGLLVTCHNPRHFYGQNLVRRLKEQVQLSSNFTHPIAYLTLCNAKESWPLKAINDLDRILSTDSKYPFIRDYQSIAAMAISCFENQTNLLNSTENSNLKTHYDSMIQQFKQMQQPDGSFGNFHTTSLITQALLSSGQEFSNDWKLNATMKYLMKKLALPHDLLASYLSLPILNAKSLSDVAKVNCTLNPRRSGYDNISSEISDYAGPKIRIQYSLYVGDEIDVIHTISLRIPENYTAYDAMELASTEDSKFNLKYENISGMMYVYEINGIANDPEDGSFWLLYQGLTNVSNSLIHYNFGPDQLILEDKGHLVMWYKKAQF